MANATPKSKYHKPKSSCPELDKEDTLPWELLKGESAIAYSHFRVYRDLGESRSFPKLAAQLGKAKDTLYAMSFRHRWRERIVAWDKYLDAQKLKYKLKAIEEMEKRHSIHAQAIETGIMVPVDKFIKKFQSQPDEAFKDASLTDLLAYVYKTAEAFTKITDAERKARGVPNEISKQAIDATSGGEPIKPVINIVIHRKNQDEPTAG